MKINPIVLNTPCQPLKPLAVNTSKLNKDVFINSDKTVAKDKK